MKGLDNKRILFLLTLVDVFVLIQFYYTIFNLAHLPALSIPVIVLLSLLWVVLFFIFLRSDFLENTSLSKRIANHLSLSFTYGALISFYILATPSEKPDTNLFLYFISGLGIIGIPRVALQAIFFSHIKSINPETKILILGAGKIGAAIQNYLKINPGRGKFIGFLEDNPTQGSDQKILGTFNDFEKVFQQHHFNEVIITVNQGKTEVLSNLIDFSEHHGVRPSIVINLAPLVKRNFEFSKIGGIPLINIREVPLDYYVPRFWKRGFDLLMAILALIILSPIFLIVAIAIKIESEGPIFYTPIRIGKRGKKIKMFKFRSMYHDPSPDQGKTSTLKNDSRITKVGRLIRKLSIDELPQLLNVLEGTMSIVGPRPHRVDLDTQFREIMPTYTVRRYIKPGITGWAQVNGWRGLTKSKHDFVARTLHDLWYIEHWSFGLDLTIIFLTLFSRKPHKGVF